MSTLVIDRDAVRAELEKAFDERTSGIMLGVLERVAAQTLAAGVPREDFTELKEIVTRLGERMEQAAARQDRFEARMEQFETRLDQLTARVDQLTARVDQLTARVDQLTEQVARLAHQIFELTAEMERFKQETANNFAKLKGIAKEQYYRERGVSIFGRVLSKGKDASAIVAEAAYRAVEEDRLTEQEQQDILDADLFWGGEFKKQPVILVGEISWTINREDVERAVRRAARLRKLGFKTAPFVAGEEWVKDSGDLAWALKVLSAQDGRMDTSRWRQLLAEEYVKTPDA